MAETPQRARPSLLLWLGLVLTVGLFSGYRPWGDSPINVVFLAGPVLLAVAAAGHLARSGKATEPGRESAPAGRVVGLGLLMILVGGCPWLYTPLLTGGESNQASGMLGTIIFLLIGLPGLAVTATGLIMLVSKRGARGAAEPSPDTGVGEITGE